MTFAIDSAYWFELISIVRTHLETDRLTIGEFAKACPHKMAPCVLVFVRRVIGEESVIGPPHCKLDSQVEDVFRSSCRQSFQPAMSATEFGSRCGIVGVVDLISFACCFLLRV